MSTIQLMVDSKNPDRTGVTRQRLRAAFNSHPDRTQEALAVYCGVTKQAVSKWLRTGEVSRKNVPKVEEFFGQPHGWLEGLETRPRGLADMEFEELKKALSKAPDSLRRKLIKGYIRSTIEIMEPDEPKRAKMGMKIGK